jgi:hypothetical protein
MPVGASLRSGRRRLLESAVAEIGKVRPILPGRRFQATDLLLTNFHLPMRMRWPPATASFPMATPV